VIEYHVAVIVSIYLQVYCEVLQPVKTPFSNPSDSCERDSGGTDSPMFT